MQAFSDKPQARLQSINTQLINAGLASVMIYAPNTTLAKETRQDEQRSQERKQGQWATTPE
jgi:endonuclease YncB( thermonuclease family)